MRGVRHSVLFVLLPALLLLPTSASAFTVSLPSGSAVKIDSPSRLAFTVTNTGANEGLSRLVLRFPSGYRVTGGSAPPGWTVEPGPAGSTGEGGEITFRTTDEVKCVDAMGLPIASDMTHLTTQAQVRLGKMLADAYIATI